MDLAGQTCIVNGLRLVVEAKICEWHGVVARTRRQRADQSDTVVLLLHTQFQPTLSIHALRIGQQKQLYAILKFNERVILKFSLQTPKHVPKSPPPNKVCIHVACIHISPGIQ